jgi:hypothetical protein
VDLTILWVVLAPATVLAVLRFFAARDHKSGGKHAP